MPDFAAKEPLESLLFATPAVGVGTFRCRPDDPLFRDSGPSSTYCFVFPRRPVWIRHAGGDPFIADPRTVTYYNEGQVYSRRRLSPDGDRGDWFAMDPDLAAEIVAEAAPELGSPREGVFAFSHGPCDEQTYLFQRRLTEYLRATSDPDPLEVEEAAVTLLARLVPMAARTSRRSPRAVTARQARLVDEAKALVAVNARRRITLSALAACLSCSVFHLCRTFRQIEQTTIHGYQQDQRLRLALEEIEGGRKDLTGVALDLGFCSHSHFTAAFRRRFGLTPSARTRGPRARAQGLGPKP